MFSFNQHHWWQKHFCLLTHFCYFFLKKIAKTRKYIKCLNATNSIFLFFPNYRWVLTPLTLALIQQLQWLWWQCIPLIMQLLGRAAQQIPPILILTRIILALSQPLRRLNTVTQMSTILQQIGFQQQRVRKKSNLTS